MVNQSWICCGSFCRLPMVCRATIRCGGFFGALIPRPFRADFFPLCAIFFSRPIAPQPFQAFFFAFGPALPPNPPPPLIAIDGKTSRRSHDGTVKALHLVSAFATEARLVLAQTATAQKSNEISAIPELLKL